MKWLAALALVTHLGACAKEPDPFPITPGGGGGTGTETMADAAIGDDAGSMINGRVCLLLSIPQSLTSCAVSGAAGLTVMLGSAMATTADDGSFTLMRPVSTSGLVWSVTGSGIKPSVIKYGATTTLPAIGAETYQAALDTAQTFEAQDQGALMTRVTRAGAPVSGAAVASLPQPDSLVYYDEPSALTWNTDLTGPLGVAWIPRVTAGNAQLTITSNQTPTVVMGNSVVAGAITFVLAEIP